MPTAVQTVSENTRVACHSSSCEDSGCSLSMDGLNGPHILIDLENEESPADQSIKHCDFLFFGMPNRAGTELVVAIELTTGQSKTENDILGQLSGGATLADNLVPQVTNVRFKAVLGNKGLHRYDFNSLRKMRVPFRNALAPIKTLRCGSLLLDALS